MFNDIDRYTKTIVHAYIDKHVHAPKWMGAFSKTVGYNNVGFLGMGRRKGTPSS